MTFSVTFCQFFNIVFISANLTYKIYIFVIRVVFTGCINRIPQQTSVHLRNLLLGLLRRNPAERMSYGSSQFCSFNSLTVGHT